MRPGFVTIGRWVAAALILGGGAIHLKLYFDSYRDFPNANLGRSFLLTFALSRTSNGIFDFTETGFNPSPEAVLSLVFEIGAAVVLIGLLVVEWAGARREVAPAQ